MKVTLLCSLLAFVALSSASACTGSHSYATSAESGHFGCDSYNDRLTISWLIQLTDATKRVMLTFTEFDTEANYDFVKIYDGTSSSAPLLGSFSGSVIPGPFSSSSNALYVLFTSDEYVEGDGFNAEWTSFAMANGITPCTTSQAVELSGDSGSFGCNGYGNQISSSWHITGNAGEKIVLSFDTFATERTYDVVTVYDGSGVNAEVIGTFSGSDLPPPLTASRNELYITFVTDYSLTSTGFSASWSSLVQFADPCFNSTNKVLLPYEGYLGCPYGYGNNVNSTWLIHIIGDFIIRLDFLTLNTEEGHDYVSVYDGSSSSARLIGRYSGQTTPDSITSSGNQLFVMLTTDRANVASGFTATYQTVHALQPGGCSRSGTFVFTTDQDSLGCEGYLSGVIEEWHLVAQSEEEVINLTWHSFDTESGHDMVYVYDGNTTDSTLVYSVSGSTIPDPVVSSSNTLVVKFIADSDGIQGSGFSAVYESVAVETSNPTDCQSNHDYYLTEQEGIFGCDGYANSVTITWQVHVESGYTIALQWNTFFTEGLYDYVTVYDGPDENGTPIGSWSGAFRPPTVTSNSNYLYIVFTSDGGVTRSGFTAEYSSVFTGSDADSCFSSQSNRLTDNEGTFGCTGYGNNVEITWQINTASGTTIGLEFTQFQTEFNYDLVKVYDGPNANAHLLATYSGYVLPEPVHSSSNTLYVVFTSDDSIQYDGFRAAYHAEEAASTIGACTSSTHSTLSEPAGQFGCNKYGNSIDSSWLISLPQGQRITIDFEMISTELYYDYVKIYDGTGTHDPLLGTFSGDTPPSSMTSTGSSLYVTFHSDSSVSSSYDGFILQYVSFGSFLTPCSSNAAYELDASSGSFGCDGYSSSVTVTWSISSFGSIFVNFDQFNTETNYDVLRIYDGSNDSAPLLAQYSGTYAPPISSTGSNMFVKFTSDSSINRSGFSASFATIIIDRAAPMSDDEK